MPYPDRYPAETRLWSLLDVMKRLERRGPHAFQIENGRSWHYSTIMADLLGQIVATVEAKPLEHVLTERIYSKIGAEEDAFVAADSTGAAAGGTGLTITLRDMGRLAAMLANDGFWNGEQIVPLEVLQKLRAGADPSHFPMAGFFGDGGKTISYQSMWYVGPRFMRGFGIYNQHIGIYNHSGVVIVMQSSDPYSEGGAGLSLAMEMGRRLDALYGQE